jgi:hypothetical protein
VSRHDPGIGSGKASGNMPGYDSGKIPGINLDNESGTISDDDWGRRPD